MDKKHIINYYQQMQKFIKRNILIIFLLIFTTSFFIIQHMMNLSWDFSAYVQNAKYLFYGGDYFEVYRAPLMGFLLSFFLIFKKFGEILYIIFVSCLFFYSNIKLSDITFEKYSRKISREQIRFIFYFFSLSSFVLFYATSVGTELLTLAFIELFLAYLLAGKISGHFLALAFLSRYNSLIFIPLMLFNKDYKKVIKNLVYFTIIVFPWFLFNYVKFGNWFASIIDSYALNIYLRDYLFQEFNFLALYQLITWFAPFFIIGLTISIIYFLISKNKFSNKNKRTTLFLIISLLIIYDIYNIPLKIPRYMFNLSLPVAFFSTIGIILIINKWYKTKKIIILIFLIIYLITFTGLIINLNKNNYDESFYNAASDIKKLNIEDCEILSPHWVPINYLTENARPLGKNSIKSSIYLNKIILIFTKKSTIDDLFDNKTLEDFPILYKTEEYIFIAKEDLTNKNCKNVEPYDSTLINNHCEIISKKFERLKIKDTIFKICKKINRKF
jgi:hypothetical protein